jgi:zinc-ribbon domain
VARCAWCGTENDATATACSSCGARLTPSETTENMWSSPLPPAPPTAGPVAGPLGGASGQASPPQPASAWPASLPWPEPAPPARRSLPAALWVALVAAVLAVTAVFLYMKLQQPISFPGEIAGYQHDDSQIAHAATDFLEKALKSVGIHAQAAIYGDISNPAFIVIGYKRSDSTAGASLDEFASGFDSTSGSSVVLTQQISDTRDGVDYTCAPLQSTSSSSGAQARAICMWQDDGTGGFVISAVSADPNSTMDLSTQIHDAVVH